MDQTAFQGAKQDDNIKCGHLKTVTDPWDLFHIDNGSKVVGLQVE